MAIYFNYKSPYNTLGSKFTKRIETDSILKWFQQIWRLDLDEDDLHEYFIEKFGVAFYGLGHLAYNVVERKVKKPESFDELVKVLKENSYINLLKSENEKYLEAQTDDNEFELAWYLIDEEYAKKDLSRFGYLIYEDWKFPINFNENKNLSFDFEFKTIINPIEKRKGELYFISVCQEHAEGPIENNPTKISGIRLTDLKEYLLNEKLSYEELPKELIFYLVKLKEKKDEKDEKLIKNIESFKDSILLMHQLFQSHMIINSAKLKLGFEESKNEFEKKISIFKEKNTYLDEMKEFYINGNEHFIQIAIQATFYTEANRFSSVKHIKLFDQVFIFDDLWVNENYHLANSMLNYYTNWKL